MSVAQIGCASALRVQFGPRFLNRQLPCDRYRWDALEERDAASVDALRSLKKMGDGNGGTVYESLDGLAVKIVDGISTNADEEDDFHNKDEAYKTCTAAKNDLAPRFKTAFKSGNTLVIEMEKFKLGNVDEYYKTIIRRFDGDTKVRLFKELDTALLSFLESLESSRYYHSDFTLENTVVERKRNKLFVRGIDWSHMKEHVTRKGDFGWLSVEIECMKDALPKAYSFAKSRDGYPEFL